MRDKKEQKESQESVTLEMVDVCLPGIGLTINGRRLERNAHVACKMHERAMCAALAATAAAIHCPASRPIAARRRRLDGSSSHALVRTYLQSLFTSF